MRRPIAHIVLLAAAIAAATVLQAQRSCDDCMTAHYWRVPVDGAFEFPERIDEQNALKDPRRDFGIAISGGGVRSAAAAVGQLRGLQSNKWLEKAGYISAVSGGAWAAVPFTYSKASVDDLVGTMNDQRPCDLTVSGLRTGAGAIGQAIAATNLAPGGIREGIGFALQQNDDWIRQQVQSRVKFGFINAQYANIRDAIRNKVFPKGMRQDKTYGRLLGPFFLDQLIEPVWTIAHDKQQGPLASERTFGWTADAVAHMSAGQPHGFPAEMLTTDKERPYLIVGATMVVPGVGTDDYPMLIPFEFTPLYSGSRVGRDGQGPGLYVSSWAMDTDEVAKVDGDFFRAHVDLSDPFTLADVIAATGAAPELTLLTTDKAPGQLKDVVRNSAKFFPAFSTVAFNENMPIVKEPLSFGDGGFRDNLGLMPLLARGVHNVLVFFNTNTALSQMNDDVKSLFMKVDLPGGTGNKTDNVVFDAKEYQPLYDTLLDAERQHTPQIYCKKGLEVRANALYRVRPYQGLNLCFFYAADVQQWHEELRLDVKHLFAPDSLKTNRLDQFPFYPTHELSLEAEQVDLLGSLWSWIVTRKQTVDAVTSTLVGLPKDVRIQACPVLD